MNRTRFHIKRSCLMSILVTGLTLPLVSFSQDSSTQQAPVANSQNQQTGAQNSQSQQGSAQGNQNQQDNASSSQNRQADSSSNQNQQAGATNSNQGQQARSNSNSTSKQQIDLSNYSNGSFVSLRGNVESVSPDTFVLSYNNGDEKVTVEMDDGDRDADAYVLLPGDKVTVTGLIDRDLFEQRKVEAGSVYIEKLNTYFISSAVDEEDYPMFVSLVAVEPATKSGSGSSKSGSSSNSSSSNSSSTASVSGNMPVVWLQGKVNSVSNDSLKLALGDGKNEITVSTSELSNNPLDQKSDSKIETGDIVQVSGKVDDAFFSEQKLEANSFAKIHDKQTVSQ